MKEKIINKYTIISLIFLIIFLFIIKDVFTCETISYDKWAYNFFKDLRSDELTLFMRLMTNFGSFLFISSFFLVLYLLYKNKKTIYYLLINTISILLINDFIKHLIHRSRPSDYSLINESSYSFPSSHAMVSVVFYGLLIYLVYKIVKNRKTKCFLITILTIIVLLISISRIYLGAHYLSDVIGGLSLGIIYLMIFLMFNKDFEKKV